MTIINYQQISDDLAVNWHPFMQMKDFETYPPKLLQCKGLKLFTEDTWYYDTISVGGAIFWVTVTRNCRCIKKST